MLVRVPVEESLVVVMRASRVGEIGEIGFFSGHFRFWEKPNWVD